MTTAVPSATSIVVDVAAADNNTTTDVASVRIVVERKGIDGDSDSDKWMMNG